MDNTYYVLINAFILLPFLFVLATIGRLHMEVTIGKLYIKILDP